MKKLANDMPSANLVEGYLTEIARGYGVRWTSDPDPKQVGDDDDAQDFVVSHSLTLTLSTWLILIRTRHRSLQRTWSSHSIVGNSLPKMGKGHRGSQIFRRQKTMMGKAETTVVGLYQSPHRKMTLPC